MDLRVSAFCRDTSGRAEPDRTANVRGGSVTGL